VRADAVDLRVAKVEDLPDGHFDGHAAGLAAPLDVTEHQDTVVEIAKLIGDGTELVPGFIQTRDVRFALSTAPERLGLDSAHRRHPLGGRSRVRVHGVEITPVERVYSPLDDLHVLLRHRLLRQAEVGAGTLTV